MSLPGLSMHGRPAAGGGQRPPAGRLPRLAGASESKPAGWNGTAAATGMKPPHQAAAAVRAHFNASTVSWLGVLVFRSSHAPVGGHASQGWQRGPPLLGRCRQRLQGEPQHSWHTDTALLLLVFWCAVMLQLLLLVVVVVLLPLLPPPPPFLPVLTLPPLRCPAAFYSRRARVTPTARAEDPGRTSCTKWPTWVRG